MPLSEHRCEGTPLLFSAPSGRGLMMKEAREKEKKMNLMVKMERELVHVWTRTGRVVAFIGICLFAAVGFAAESISITATPRYPWNGKVDLKFTIDGTSGTKYDTSFTAKDVAGGTNLTMRTLYKSDGSAANVAKEQLLPGTYNWVWDATADLGEGTVLEKVVVEGKVVVYNPLYMVIDLSGGTSAKSYPVSYLDAVPSGGWTDKHKGDLLVLRKVKKGTNKVAGSMSSDMWVGVFEVTQKQYKNVMGKTPSTYVGDYRPVEHAAYFACVDFMSRVSKKTDTQISLRMPTRNEWRYACRAGNTAATYAVTKSTGRYYENGGSKNKHAVVGSYSPNTWGLYDMLGNVYEWTSTGLTGDSSSYESYKSGGSWNTENEPVYYITEQVNDGKYVLGGTSMGGDDEEGFRVFGVAD